MSFVLAHLSDAHISPLPRPKWHELIGKRATGYANWLNGRARAHDMGVLGRLVKDLKGQGPDHIAMTGDVINLGLRAEYPLGRDWLIDLCYLCGVSFVPGNHDAYARDTFAEIVRAFGPWMGSGKETGSFPYVHRPGKLALIGLSSAIPTAPFLASGALGADQLTRLPMLLRNAKAQGRARVILIHHPPHRAGAPASRGLRDAGALEAVIAREGAELILHGHNHRMSLARIAGPSGPVPVAGVASASLRPGAHGHGAGYRLFRIEEHAAGWLVGMRTRVMGGDGAMQELEAAEGWQDIGAVRPQTPAPSASSAGNEN